MASRTDGIDSSKVHMQIAEDSSFLRMTNLIKS